MASLLSGPAAPAALAPCPVAYCVVCAETLNLSTRAPVTCEFCPFTACKECTRQFLLTAGTGVHCMECKKTWTPRFLVQHLNRSFVDTVYKKKVADRLVETEMSKLPGSMAAAQVQTLVETAITEKGALLLQVVERKRELFALEMLVNEKHNQINTLKRKTAEPEERKKFVMPCPNGDCRGFLSTQYKCGLCELFTCSDCHDVIGASKTLPHTCDPANIQSAELIKKETKACPGCSSRIFKLSGCDQMWCPQCKVAFSWLTGKIDTGVVHNPHFYQYQRQTNGGEAPRNPGDVPCGGLITWSQLNRQILQKIRFTPASETVGELHRTVNHIREVELPALRQKVRLLNEDNNESIRVKYILSRCSKDAMAQALYHNAKQLTKTQEEVHILELLATTGLEVFQKWATAIESGATYLALVQADLEQLENLRLYCNAQLAQISVTYSQIVKYIMPEFEMRTKKYTLKCKNEALRAAGLQEVEDEPVEVVAKKKRKRVVAAPPVAMATATAMAHAGPADAEMAAAGSDAD